VAAPWIAPDEALYGLIGRSLAGDSVPVAAGTETSLLTPLLLAVPLFVVDDVARAFGIVQVLQAVLVSATAAIAFGWARPLAGPRWALLAAFLTVAIPGLAYSGLLMTESTFYVTTTLALLALARVVERPTLVAQSLFLVAAALAVAARLQGLALLAAAVAAIGIAAAGERSTLLVRRTAPLLVTIGAVVIGGAVALVAGARALGIYSGAVTAGYEVVAVATDLLHHAGAVFLIVGGVPLVALGLMLGHRVPPGPSGRPLRALVAVTLGWTVVLVVQVGIFASQFVGHLAERDLLTVAPPLFVLFAVWLSRGMPRPGLRGYVGAVAVTVPALALPIGSLATRESQLDSFSSISFHKLTAVTSAGTTTLVWAAWVALAAAFVMVVPARRRLVVAMLAVAALLPLSAVAALEVRTASRADERWWFSESSPTWVDERADGPVTFLYGGSGDWGGVWKHVFWNRRILSVASIDAANPVPGPITQSLVAPASDGGLHDSSGRPVVSPYVVAPAGMRLDGAAVASMGPSGTLAGLVLWQPAQPLRVREWVRGLGPDGQVTPGVVVAVTGWNCRGATLSATFFASQASTVRVGALRWRERTADVPAGGAVTLEVGAPPVADRCEFALAASSPVSVTRLELLRPN
jgi:hypothetical protein